MTVITKEKLELDVLDGKYLDKPAIVYLSNGQEVKGVIDSYTYDDEPFKNYIVIDEDEYPFEQIKKIELI